MEQERQWLEWAVERQLSLPWVVERTLLAIAYLSAVIKIKLYSKLLPWVEEFPEHLGQVVVLLPIMPLILGSIAH